MNFLKIKINQKSFFGAIIVAIFSIGANQYYGNLGIFPHDSFSHFDTGNMILNGFHPFKDFWIVSGPFVDYFQALLFFLFGTSWKVYVFHASLVNLLVTVFTFFILRNLDLNIKQSIFFSLCFSILAYPSSGTPFVDHHSAFFSLMGVYLIILCIKKDSKFISFFIPLFFIFAFLSKQVPSAYFIIGIIPIFFCYIILNKKNYLLPPFFLGGAIFISILFIFGLLNGIKLNDFIEQYFFYPQSIASQRFSILNISVLGIIGNFKFIFLSLIILAAANYKSFNKKKLFKNERIFIIGIIFFSSLILVFHQIFTRNQIFIFFLIPLIIGIANVSIKNKTFSFFTILLCLITTMKYHERFNEGRKFHELEGVNFNIAINASAIDKKLEGLKWITPQFKTNPKREIEIINKIKSILEKETRNKMVLGNYPFLSVIINQNLSSPTRWHVLDGTDYPLPESNFFDSYKRLVDNVIKKNNIEVIYSIIPVKSKNIHDLINKECLKETKINEYFFKYEIKNDC